MSEAGPVPLRPGPSARAEWAAMWPLPFVALTGIAGAATFAYSSGIFMSEMTGEFGWTRAQFSSAFALQFLVGIVSAPIVGHLVGRFGSRRIALAGIVPYVIGISLLGLADGSLLQWRLLVVLQGLGTALIGPAVWITAVVGRFSVSRGLAMAVGLAGIGVATGLWPLAANWYIGMFGWRGAFPALGLSWAAVMLPLTWFCFFGVRDVEPPGAPPAGVQLSPAASPRSPLVPALLSRTYVFLVMAGTLFACFTFGLIVHLVPLLQDKGTPTTVAAALAGVMGLSSIVGRIGTGFMLDRIDTRPLAIFVFLLPIPISALLWLGGDSLILAAVAVALLGLAGGAETDIITFIAASAFEHRIFASIYAIAGTVFGVGASLGPLLAGALFDANGSYDVYLALAVPFSLAGALLVAFLPHRGAPERTTQ